jgi:hypothetical protein
MEELIVKDERGNKWKMTPIEEAPTSPPNYSITATIEDEEIDFPFKVVTLLTQEGELWKDTTWLEYRKEGGSSEDSDTWDNIQYLRKLLNQDYEAAVYNEFPSTISKDIFLRLKEMLHKAKDIGWL